jgi:hypothetical protein
VVGSEAERNLLLKVEPVRIFLCDYQLHSKALQVNPYQSVGWLRDTIEDRKGQAVKLIVNDEELTEDRNSLMRYIHEDALVHIVTLKSQKCLEFLLVK